MVERAEQMENSQIVAALGAQRWMFLRTADGLTDEQARTRSTVSELTIGGLVKHLTEMERQWTAFAQGGAEAMDAVGGQFESEAAAYASWTAQFRMEEDETLADLVETYQAAAAETDACVMTLADLETAQALPARPWFDAGATWSARQTFLHLLVEIAQHSGHADIIREAIDGKKSMG